ncbi:MAG: hypothetical protein ACLU4N_26665 [Butyricimonas faecihominis]
MNTGYTLIPFMFTQGYRVRRSVRITGDVVDHDRISRFVVDTLTTARREDYEPFENSQAVKAGETGGSFVGSWTEN